MATQKAAPKAAASAEKSTKAAPAAKSEKGDNKVAGILTGRMPIPCVYAIKFLEEKEQTDTELAKKYCTTAGKINDIRKEAGFPYVTKNLVITAAEIKEARATINAKLESNDREVTADQVKYMLKKLGEIETGETSNLDELREKHRKPRGKAKAKAKSEDSDEAEEVAEEEEEELGDLVE